MILYHQLTTSPVRASDAVPMQRQLEQERRARLERIHRTAALIRPPRAFTVRPFRAAPPILPTPATWDYPEPAPYDTMDFSPIIPHALSAREIIDQVTIKHGVSRADLAGGSRKATVTAARREASYRIRTEVLVSGRRISLPEIARHLGGRDHTTVLYNIRRYEAELAAKAGG